MVQDFRLKNSALYRSGGKYHYSGKPYTGTIFIEEGDNVKAYDVVDGVEVSEYQNPYFDATQRYLATHTLPKSKEPLAHYKDQVVHGTTYSFLGEFCDKETLYFQGHKIHTISYYPTGQVKEYRIFIGKSNVTFKFTESQDLQYFKIANDEQNWYGMSLERQNRMSYLNIYGNAMSGVIRLKDLIPFNYPKTVKEICSYTADRLLFLSGKGISSEVLNLLLDNNSLSNVTSLNFHEVQVTVDDAKKLLQLPNLKRASINDNSGHLGPTLREAHKKRKGLEVSYTFDLQ